MKKSKGTMKQKATVLLGAVTALCALLGGALLPRKVSAESATETYIAFYEANAYDATTAKVLYYDANNTQSYKGNVMIYPNGRFNPTASYEATLTWSAPEAGSVTIQEKTIKLSVNSEKVEKSDGVRWALLKVGADGKCTAVTDEFWHTLKCTSESTVESSKSTETANYGGQTVQMEKGAKIAIVIDCGGNKNNNFDQPYVTASMKFTPIDGEEKEYAFNTNDTLSKHVTALTSEEATTAFEMGVAATNYYSWGASTFTEKQTLTADTETSEFKQTNVMDGKTENELVAKSGSTGQWFVAESNNSYSVVVNGTAAKICSPQKYNDTQLVWKAPAAGVFSLDSLSLNIEKIDSCDGMKYAVLYKNAATGNYYDLYENNEIDGDAPWHDLQAGAEQAQTITTLPDFAMAKDDEFIVMFNPKNTNANDACTFNIAISFAANGEEATKYEIKPGTSAISAQGTNDFWFRNAVYAQSIAYTQNSTIVKADAYTDGYTLSSGAVVALGANEQFVGWRYGNDLYPAGGAYTFTETSNNLNTLTAVVITMSTEKGAGLRVSTTTDDAGIRFVSNFNLSELKEKEYTFGTLVALASDELNETTFVKDGSGVRSVAAVKYETTDDGFKQNAAVTSIPEANYTTELRARGYVTVSYKDGTSGTFYANLSDARSVAYVAYMTYDDLSTRFDLENNKDLKTVVDAFKDAYSTEE